MPGIKDFIKNKGQSCQSCVMQLQEASKNKSKSEIRDLEKHLLKPEKIPPYAGPVPLATELERRTIKIIFPDVKTFKLFEKYFFVSHSIENSTHRIGLLLALLNNLENGDLRYDKESGTLTSVER